MGEVLDGLLPLMGDAEDLPAVLLAEEDLIGELLLRGDEAPLEADIALGGVEGLGEGKADLMNSANSEYTTQASPSVSILLTMARFSISLE